jgi:hypothetical protein
MGEREGIEPQHALQALVGVELRNIELHGTSFLTR